MASGMSLVMDPCTAQGVYCLSPSACWARLQKSHDPGHEKDIMVGQKENPPPLPPLLCMSLNEVPLHKTPAVLLLL